MKSRFYFLLILAFVSFNLFGQAKIISVTYDGDEATLTRNTPPAGMVYYWQGTSCGDLTDNSDLTYIATTSSTYYLRGYASSAASWAVSCASTIVFFPDVTAPILSGVTAGPVEVGDNISATSNEDGMIYLVPDGTASNVGAIDGAKVASATATASAAVILSTTGAGLGDYIVYAVDGSDNVSAASAIIAVVDVTAPILSDVTGGPVETGNDILATSNENGMIYLVPNGTAPNVGDIGSAQVSQATSVAGVPSNLSTTGIAAGDYVVYALDASDNISAASAVISVNYPVGIGLNKVTGGEVQLYPVNVKDILHIKSNIQVSSAVVYTLQGSQVINIGTPTESIDMSGLNEGIYIVSIKLSNNTIFTGKVTKK